MGIAYKRILLKLSGEVLAGAAGKGIDNDTVINICKSVKKVADAGVEVAIVVSYDPLYFCDVRCYFSCFISNFIDLSLLSFFLDKSG